MMMNLKKEFFSLLRKLPPFKGKGRLARLLFGKFIESQKDIIVPGKSGIKYKLPNLVENIGFDINLNGTFEQDTCDFIASKLPPGAVFIDIGANIGAITIPVCKKRGDIKAYCVEASATVFGYLVKNISLNKITNAVLINKAITDTNGGVVNFYSPVQLFGKGSRSPVYTNTPESIETISFSGLCKLLNIGKVDLVKVDVEGFEYDVFKGGKEFFEAPDAPDIIFEFLKWAEVAAYSRAAIAQELLKDFGYTLYEFGPKVRLTPIEETVKKNYAMIFATKKI